MATRWMTAVGTALLAGVAAAGDEAAFDTEQEKRSYALGMAIGTRMRADQVDLDLDAYLRGLKDARAGKALLTDQEARAALAELQDELRKDREKAKDGGRAPRGAPPPAEADPAKAEAPGLTVSFKVDPRVTKSLYMGERWVSNSSYSRVQDGKSALVVEVRAHGRDAGGKSVPLRPTWTPADANIVTVSPREGHEVKLTILHPGRTSVEVAYGGRAKKLTVNAVEERGLLRVDISG